MIQQTYVNNVLAQIRKTTCPLHQVEKKFKISNLISNYQDTCNLIFAPKLQISNCQKNMKTEFHDLKI
jgi:hypothetical protein